VFCPLKNSFFRQTSTLGRQRKIILAPKAERVKVVKGVNSDHRQWSLRGVEQIFLYKQSHLERQAKKRLQPQT
jgi:hypothetical protein